MYSLHVKSHWITLNMVYGVSKGLSYKVLVHNTCNLKLWMLCSWWWNWAFHLRRLLHIESMWFILMLKASGWCVGVMHWTDLESCFSIKIRSKKTLIPPLVLMILILNPERIVYSDVKCRSLWCIYGCDQIDGQHTRCVGWSQLTLWESLESKSFLKMIRNFSLRLILWIGLF